MRRTWEKLEYSWGLFLLERERERENPLPFNFLFCPLILTKTHSLLSALMRISMGLHLSASELASIAPLERNCSKQIAVVNDIYSWGKRGASGADRPLEGSALCPAVKVLADETNLSTGASKRVLCLMIREWKLVHKELVIEIEKVHCSEAVRDYMKGLEYQMSGNEQWSRTTLRYITLE